MITEGILQEYYKNNRNNAKVFFRNVKIKRKKI